MIKAQRIRYLDSGIEIENPAPAVPCYIKSGRDILSVETFKDKATLTFAKDSSGRITSINGNAMYRLKAGEFNADIAPESIFNIRYDSGNPKYLIQGLADARYGLVKTRSTDKNTVVSFEQIGNDNMFNMGGAGEVTYADYYKGVAFAEGTISGKFNVNDFEINTEMAKNDFAFKKDGKDYVYDIVNANSKQFYAVTYNYDKYSNLDPRTTTGLIFDVNDPEKPKTSVGNLEYNLNGAKNILVNGILKNQLVEPDNKQIQAYVWQPVPKGLYYQTRNAGEYYLSRTNLRQIPYSAPAEIFNIEDTRGRPLFLRRTQQGFEVIDPNRDFNQVIYSEQIDFNDVDQYRAFTERLTRVNW